MLRSDPTLPPWGRRAGVVCRAALWAWGLIYGLGLVWDIFRSPIQGTPLIHVLGPLCLGSIATALLAGFVWLVAVGRAPHVSNR